MRRRALERASEIGQQGASETADDQDDDAQGGVRWSESPAAPPSDPADRVSDLV